MIASSALFRDVTPSEIEHYDQYGWVKLRKFLGPEVIEAIYSRGRARMGADGDSNSPDKGEEHGYFNQEICRGIEDPELEPLFSAIGRAAKALMGRSEEIGVRYFFDAYAVKLPSNREHTHKGAGRTDFHQDFSSTALDRIGGMMFWVALRDLPPEAGTMAFLDGSHRMGPLAAHSTHMGHDIMELYPRLGAECPSSGALAYEAGDVTVHSSLCVHGTGVNTTEVPRWAYIVGVNPSDTCWTGAPNPTFSSPKLAPFKPLDDEIFPIIYR